MLVEFLTVQELMLDVLEVDMNILVDYLLKFYLIFFMNFLIFEGEIPRFKGFLNSFLVLKFF